MTQDTRALRSDAALRLTRLLEWTADAQARALPDAVRRRAATILIDDIGAIVAGAREPQVRRAREAMLRVGAPAGEATVFAAGAPRAERGSAACANGMAITWCELDEGFRNASCHAGAYTLPVLLAEAEARAISVDALLRQVALAYEVTTRIALAYPFPVFNVHPHAAFAPIGAAVAASLARGHDAATMRLAVTGGASMSFAGPFDTAVEGSLARNGWTAAGAWIGLRSAEWAEAGIGGGPATPHDVFTGSFGTRALPQALTDGLGETWSVSNGYHKIFACCAYAHAAVEATLELRERAGAQRIAEIEEIVVETGPGGQALTTVEPPTVLAAKFSLPHAAAAAAVLGTAGARAFDSESLTDAAIARMRRRVRLAPFENLPPFPRDRPARVTWRLAGGHQLTALCESARGGADQPFDEATLLEKLHDNTADTFPALRASLEPVLAGEARTLARPWRDLVAQMTGGRA